MTSWLQWEKALTDRLSGIYEPSEAAVIAGWVMEKLSGKDKLSRRFAEPFEPEEGLEHLYHKYQSELLTNRPVQYVLGEAYFSGRKFFVDASVLIPRPETEELVAWILSDNKDNKGVLNVLDIGTGSGCIAISLQCECPGWHITATDIKDEALKVASRNAVHLQAPVIFQKQDILEAPVNHSSLYDIIVSNPPYITGPEQNGMAPHVLDYEPATALFVTNEDPLQFYKAIERFARQSLKKGGKLYLELNQYFAGDTALYFKQNGWQEILREDIFGNPRMLSCQMI